MKSWFATYQTTSFNPNRPVALHAPSLTQGSPLSGGGAVSEARYGEDVWILGAQASAGAGGTWGWTGGSPVNGPSIMQNYPKSGNIQQNLAKFSIIWYNPEQLNKIRQNWTKCRKILKNLVKLGRIRPNRKKIGKLGKIDEHWTKSSNIRLIISQYEKFCENLIQWDNFMKDY